jgi:hypothetical protein
MGTSTPKMGKGTPMSLRSILLRSILLRSILLRSILLDAGPRRNEERFSSCGS